MVTSDITHDSVQGWWRPLTALGTTLVAMDLVVVCLLVHYLNSTAVQTLSRTVLAVAMDLLGV